MKYKVGDRVRIVSKSTEKMNWTEKMDIYLGTVMTIADIIHSGVHYKMVEDKGEWFWNDSMIAGLASETPFDFGAWKGKKVCMHCKTQEEAKDFCCEMDRAGLKWDNGGSHASEFCFILYKNNTCYCFNQGTYDHIERAKDKGYTILEWSDYRSIEPLKEEHETTEMKTHIDDKPLSYQEAMRISRRMCESYERCDRCPLDYQPSGNGKTCWDALRDDSNEAEKVLKKWAAEHPVKTNGQKCEEMFLEVFGMQYATALMHPDWWQQEYVEPYKEKE